MCLKRKCRKLSNKSIRPSTMSRAKLQFGSAQPLCGLGLSTAGGKDMSRDSMVQHDSVQYLTNDIDRDGMMSSKEAKKHSFFSRKRRSEGKSLQNNHDKMMTL